MSDKENDNILMSRGAYMALHHIWTQANNYMKFGKQNPEVIEAWLQIMCEIEETKISEIID